ncbi:MAG: tRNA (N6-threonylcarbamoyladenosine(37)-N6)-methyltransferase TrmO [Desulfobacteraceae bacterium 4572_88]|nr:MAG: tRNA (N6-threonylcarbamoyladenosine(37)-N6)-methyltransferase TrmO [Desulfobacteraceae bacterium 4572_88]
MNITFSPIGTIRSPFQDVRNMPIQPTGAKDTEGQVLVEADYAEGLDDLEGFSHIILLYHFHQSEGFHLKVTPFMDNEPRGLFSTRAPRRPNGIGLSIVQLLKRDGRILHIRGVDVLDGTPLLDIKPYVPKFDSAEVSSIGWLEKKAQKSETLRSDDRFLAK